MMDMMEAMGVWALILLLVLLVGIATAVYVGVRAAKGSSRREGDTARDALRERLAAGEISLDEFYERDSALRHADEPRRAGRRA
jgi:uncharacterized membrane protein